MAELRDLGGHSLQEVAVEEERCEVLVLPQR